MISFASKIRTAAALGAPNLARVAGYRLGVRLGINPVRKLRAAPPQAPFFAARNGAPLALQPTSQWRDSALWFSRWPVPVSARAPDWHANPISGKRVAAHASNWWEIADFDPAVGDIKLVWEASRFDWVLALAQRARNAEPGALDQLNAWLADWCEHNPPYKGPNWKCGQEASIRIMHLAMASIVLGHAPQARAGMADLVRLHLRRIAPTIAYAMAQDNNHGTSEAAALFIGGAWLAGQDDPEAAGWLRSGRRWLENRAARLIGADGSFSQYSLTYHRVMLDTLSMVELWRQRTGQAPFSSRFHARARAATDWLAHMVDPDSGDGPNLGANDGARLLQLGDGDYRDFRPALQLAAALFMGQRACGADGPWNAPLQWLGVALPATALAAPGSRVFDDGGFAVLRRGRAMALLRYPRFRFRPSQADALHLDLWVGGQNLLRDAGTYSYNSGQNWIDYFGGTASHNTVQFDGRDQMPRWSRFLFADWLRATGVQALAERAGTLHFGAGYGSAGTARHARSVALQAHQLSVTDTVAGFADKAVLRWRLAPGPWRVDGHSVSNGRDTLSISATVPIARLELVEGWESRHYLDKTALPVLEIEVHVSGEITSLYRWET
jgi:hypothetical protein